MMTTMMISMTTILLTIGESWWVCFVIEYVILVLDMTCVGRYHWTRPIHDIERTIPNVIQSVSLLLRTMPWYVRLSSLPYSYFVSSVV